MSAERYCSGRVKVRRRASGARVNRPFSTGAGGVGPVHLQIVAEDVEGVGVCELAWVAVGRSGSLQLCRRGDAEMSWSGIA